MFILQSVHSLKNMFCFWPGGFDRNLSLDICLFPRGLKQLEENKGDLNSWGSISFDVILNNSCGRSDVGILLIGEFAQK